MPRDTRNSLARLIDTHRRKGEHATRPGEFYWLESRGAVVRRLVAERDSASRELTYERRLSGDRCASLVTAREALEQSRSALYRIEAIISQILPGIRTERAMSIDNQPRIRVWLTDHPEAFGVDRHLEVAAVAALAGAYAVVRGQLAAAMQERAAAEANSAEVSEDASELDASRKEVGDLARRLAAAEANSADAHRLLGDARSRADDVEQALIRERSARTALAWVAGVLGLAVVVLAASLAGGM